MFSGATFSKRPAQQGSDLAAFYSAGAAGEITPAPLESGSLVFRQEIPNANPLQVLLTVYKQGSSHLAQARAATLRRSIRKG